MYAQELGAFSLKRMFTPPKWARQIAGAIFRGTTVTVPTPAGPQTFDLGDPDSLRALQDMVRRAKIRVQTPRPSIGPVEYVTENVPGGWLTIAALGLGAVLLFSMMGRRGR